jgi:hypothetical protein
MGTGVDTGVSDHRQTGLGASVSSSQSAESRGPGAAAAILFLALAGIALHLFCLWAPPGLGGHALRSGANLPLYLVLALGGTPLLDGLLRNLFRAEFGSALRGAVPPCSLADC